MNTTQDRYKPIEDYGIIGNLHTAALISKDASIDFLCFPRFDSPTMFCKLLDADKGGSFSIRPVLEDVVLKQMYLPDTNVLVTRFLSEQGIAEVIDFMPVIENERGFRLIRRVLTVRGKISFKMHCHPRFNYARGEHKIEITEDGIAITPANKEQPSLYLRTTVDVKPVENDLYSEFALEEGQILSFILDSEKAQKRDQQNFEEEVRLSYLETIAFWQNWIAKSTYNGRWREIVNRSALTLKLLICRVHGSMVAAPTFSLPESIGHERNWDYRFTWIRDAAFSLHAFMELGFKEEAAAFLGWIKKQSTDQELQLMFALDGNSNLPEKTLDHLEGYKNSRPVRIGNEAHRQTQMDIYGELLETIYIFSLHEGDLTYDFWKIITGYIETVIKNWREPDHSIWEVRGPARRFLFSAIMCWVAIDRAIKIANKHSFPYNILRWHEVRDTIYKDVHEHFWSDELQAYVPYPGATTLDSSVLMMVMLNMTSPFSDKWQSTLAAIDKQLRSDVLLYRYRQHGGEIDGLDGREGTFTMCSFWHVECLALSGEIEKAKEHFEKMLGYANHLGLFAEQLGRKGEFLGNFPQAFTHLGLISAAIELSKAEKEPKIKKQSFIKKAK